MSDSHILVAKKTHIDWPCGQHHFVNVKFQITRDNEHLECPYCVLKMFISRIMENHNEDDSFNDLIEIGLRTIKNHEEA